MVLSTLLLSLTLAQGYAPTREGTTPLDTEREARVQRLGKQLRCAVCQGVSIADSPASMARAQLDKVRELVAQNKTDEDIFDYFVERYGEWALMEPRKSGVTLGLWLFPLVLLGVGLVIILTSARRRSAAEVEAIPLPEELAAKKQPVDDSFLAQVRADLDK
jgi:cytochrome c-type biogenesis protein CcmH